MSEESYNLEVMKDECVIIMGPSRMTLYSPMMDGESEIPETGVPENVQFATALVYLTKTDVDFRKWVTERWYGLVDQFMAAQEGQDEVSETPEVQGDTETEG